MGVLYILPVHRPSLNNQMKDYVKVFPLLQNKNPRETICSSHTSFAYNRSSITSRHSHLLPPYTEDFRESPSSQQLTAQINLVVKSMDFIFFLSLHVIRNKIQQFSVHKGFHQTVHGLPEKPWGQKTYKFPCTKPLSPSHSFLTAQRWWEPETEIRQVFPTCGFLLMWTAAGDRQYHRIVLPPSNH